MIRKNNRSHSGILEKARIALDKAGSNPEIALAMKKIGYGPELLKEGKEILAATREIFDENLQHKDDLSLDRTKFNKFQAEMDSRFREHRNKALIIFRNDLIVADKLDLRKKYPTKYAQWIGRMRKFYSEIVEDTEIQHRFLRLSFIKEEALAELDNIEKLEAMYAKRMMAIGESKNSTRQKDKAFAKLSAWMSDFYAAARLSLKNEPELLELLYKSV